jgi:hypothetical protein
MSVRRYRGVRVYTGLPGDFKTYTLAQVGLRAMRQGRDVWVNAGFDLRGANVFNSFQELLDAPRPKVVLWDEMPVYLSARDWQNFPAELLYEWTQVRKNGDELHYTAIDLEMVDANLRRITAWEVECRALSGLFYVRTCWPALSKRRSKLKKHVWREWGMRHRSVCRSYDTYAKVAVPVAKERSGRLLQEWSRPDEQRA